MKNKKRAKNRRYFVSYLFVKGGLLEFNFTNVTCRDFILKQINEKLMLRHNSKSLTLLNFKELKSYEN
jgi:hypothetical protein